MSVEEVPVRQLLAFIKTMIIGGLLFLFPLVFVTVVVGKAFAVMLRATRPVVDNLMPVETIVDVAVVDLVAVVAMIAGCLVAGLVARSRIGRAAYQAVDANLASLIPGYAILKARLGDAVGDEARRKPIKTIVLRLDDQSLLALEIERLPDGRVVAFLPGAPDPWSGNSVIVDAGRVTPLGIDTLALTRLLKDLGSGTAAALQAAPRM
jgi:uncharacterized membrane protein